MLHHEGLLFVADGPAVRRVPLPLNSGPSQRYVLPGRIGSMLLLDGALLVTVVEPGMLVRLKLDGGRLLETSRLRIVGGADDLAVSHSPLRAVVTSPRGEVVGVDLATMTRAWGVPVEAPRRIALIDGGKGAIVTHAIGLTHIAFGESPRVVKVSKDVLDPVVERSPAGGGAVVAFGHLPASLEPEAHMAKLMAGVMTDSVRLSGHVRAWRSRSGAKGIVAATDTEVVVLDATLAAGDRYAHSCRDPQGVALSADEQHAYLTCSDGRLADVPLGAGEPTYLSPRAPTMAHVDCANVKTGPVAHAFREDFGNAQQIHDWLRRYHCTYPHLTDLVELGRSHQDRPILALIIGRGPRLGHHRPTFFINGAHHGSELMSSTFALDAIDQLLEHKHPAVKRWWREGVVFVVVPLVNPDGNTLYLNKRLAGRKNGRDTDQDGNRGHLDGVDLNRNYPFKWRFLGERGSSSNGRNRYYRGPSPASEPETQAMMRLAESERFAGSISFHTGTLAILAPYTIPHVKNPSPNEAWTVAEEIARQVIAHPEGFLPVKRNLYAVDGTDQDWLRNSYGTLALLVEGAKSRAVDAKTRHKMVFAIRKTWTALVDRYLDGAAVGGVTVDAVLRPIEAEVSFAEIYRPERETWTSRCRDGRFDRYLSRAGSYTLRVKLGEYVVQRKIRVSARKRQRTRVVMPVLRTKRATCPTLFSDVARPATVIEVSVAH